MGNNTVKSVVKAMKVFEALVKRGSAVSLSNLSKQLNLNISTVHRLLNTLLDLGYVEQNDEGLYKLGLHSYKLADLIYRDFDLRELVHPYLEEIVETCNETTNFVILEDFKVVYIDQVESSNMMRMFAGQGSHGPAYSTGSGKALLAFIENYKLERYLQQVEFQAFTDKTIVDAEELRKELQQVRERGYALDLEEMEKGVRCVAAPIFDENDKLSGAISVSGPCSRITWDYLEDTLIPLVVDKTREITSRLQN